MLSKYISITIFFVIIFNSCQHSTEPTVSSNSCIYPNGNRNFTWRLDTLGWFPSTMGGVHAFSDDDVYAGGYFVTMDHSTVYNIIHWNGVKWSPIILSDVIAQLGNNPIDVSGDDKIMVTVGEYDFENPKPGIGEFNNQTKQWKGYQFQTSGALRAVWTDGKGYFIASGDNGMVYEKGGYTSEWKYQKAPTDHSLSRIAGVSKNEIYFRGYKSVAAKLQYELWRLNNNNWLKLYDHPDSSGMPIIFPKNNMDRDIGDISVFRCEKTDSLTINLIGGISYQSRSKGLDLNFKLSNFSDLGLPLEIMDRSGLRTDYFTPNDHWIVGTRFNFFHWNGINFQQMVIPGLPNDNITFGFQRRFKKTKTGKLFIPTQTGSSQVYVVVQGTPN